METAESWLFELKGDRFRSIAETNRDGKVSLYSRKQNDFNKWFPLIAEAVAELKRAAILDGEVAALEEHGYSRFE